MSIAIQASGLSKAYQLGEFSTGTLSRDIERFLYRLRGKEDPFLRIGETNDRTSKGKSNIVWSLKDIDFSINKGDAVGIIGRNGAGKSTLLKILSRVTTPTQGNVKVRGRIASLLEVGTGFHPELTGRENIFLNGAILGMRKFEITRKFDEIVAFAGVERYIDTPVKRYSSGMYVRLAFAVAAHLESEILIVDEVLAVGDAEFQKKCLGKMGEVSSSEGRTVLFVSHNMDAIDRLCNKCLYLKNGQKQLYDITSTVISEYLGKERQITSFIEYKGDKKPGNDLVRLLQANIIDRAGSQKDEYNLDEEVGVRIKFNVLKATNDLVCGFNLYNYKDVHVLSSHDVHNHDFVFEPGTYETIVWVPAGLLTNGLHYCGIAFLSYNPFIVHLHDVNAINFNVTDKRQIDPLRLKYSGDIPGVIRPELQWNRIQKVAVN